MKIFLDVRLTCHLIHLHHRLRRHRPKRPHLDLHPHCYHRTRSCAPPRSSLSPLPRMRAGLASAHSRACRCPGRQDSVIAPQTIRSARRPSLLRRSMASLYDSAATTWKPEERSRLAVVSSTGGSSSITTTSLPAFCIITSLDSEPLTNYDGGMRHDKPYTCLAEHIRKYRISSKLCRAH
jgi:hypothetical protein